MHCMYSVRRGAAVVWACRLSSWAKATGTLAANLEARLGQEAGGPVGYLLTRSPGFLPWRLMTTPGPLDLAEEKTLRKLEAVQSVLIETTSGGWQQGRDAAPHGDWIAQRIGARIPEANQVLRSDAGRAVLGACGCPPGLFEVAGSPGKKVK